MLLGVFVKDVQSCQVQLDVCAGKKALFVKAGGRFVTSHLIFLKNHFLIFLFRWEARNYESPRYVDKTSLVV